MLKRSDAVEEAIAPLVALRAIDYERVSGVAPGDMPSVVAGFDVIIDQFGVGSYGVAACEAMASGRVVVGNVLPSVRDHVRTTTGFDVPIVQATLPTLREVLEELVEQDPDARAARSRAGRDFVRAVHNGELAAAAIADNFLRPRL
ncbi:hypothetical protein [Demequina globuliformis]|uniref:hypothetical protein n=1 Tax=Demequina globuliformis TaxID=676202 RepID=UPI00128D4380|nr:hypothetical protein [Demequina globuliformis]